MRKITGWLYEWGDDQLKQLDRDGYSAVDILYRIWREGHVQAMPRGSQPLISDTQRADFTVLEAALFRLPQPQQNCVILRHCEIRREDGKPWTAKDLAAWLGISRVSFDHHVSRGRRKLARLVADVKHENVAEAA